jgi:tetratricopeptide (TPR) repeat protein
MRYLAASLLSAWFRWALLSPPLMPSMTNNSQQSEPRVKRAWTVILAWIGGVSAVLGFIGAVTGFFGSIQGHFHHNVQLDSEMAVAQSQSRQGDYQASVQSYADILKTEPLYRPALDQQLQATMLWVEDYHVYLKPGEDPGTAVASQLDQIIAILDAALARTQGTMAADVQAHLGWAHWLNQHVAEREFPPNAAAERDYRAALAADPSNVYANAMLGNWMTLNGGSLADAVQHFNNAVATGKARSFVRTLQLAGLGNRDEPGARAALMRAVNEMRKGGEPLDAEDKHRILGFCCDPAVTDHVELTESLSAVSADDAWQTYLWLDDRQNTGEDAKSQRLIHDFVAANIAEISGDKQKSLNEYRALQEELKNQGSALMDAIDQAIARLSHS